MSNHVAGQEALAKASERAAEELKAAHKHADVAQKAYHEDLREQGFPVPGKAG